MFQIYFGAGALRSALTVALAASFAVDERGGRGVVDGGEWSEDVAEGDGDAGRGVLADQLHTHTHTYRDRDR